MNSGYIDLSYAQVGMATLLLLVNGLASILLELKLEGSLAIASCRTVAQLWLVGLILRAVFTWERWYVVLGLMALMTVVAGAAAVGRTRYRYAGIYFNSIISVWVGSWLMTAFVLLVVLRRGARWCDPQYAIPLLGMILGNTLNGISLGLDRMGEELISRRDRLETLLCLGATRWEAARSAVQSAVRTGMIPMINSMMVVGIVSLPGLMTGQLLAGVEPAQGVKYQIVIMFLIASGTTIGTVGAVLLTYRRLFNSHHQFTAERLKPER